MQKKWGYTAIGAALIAATITVIALFTNTAMLSEIMAILTVLFCLAAISIVNTIFNKAEAKSKIEPATKRRESDSYVQQESEFKEEAMANAESAKSAAAVTAQTHRDDESGLLSSSFFPVYLEQRITAARRTLRPVSLVIFELDGLDKNDSNSPSDRNFFISAVGDVVKRTLRESDCAFRIDENTFAATMDDTTESGAVWAAERVRGVLHTGALAGRVTVSAGVACYPSHALETQDLIDCANKALTAAKERGVDQVEIATEQSS